MIRKKVIQKSCFREGSSEAQSGNSRPERVRKAMGMCMVNLGDGLRKTTIVIGRKIPGTFGIEGRPPPGK